MNPLARERTAEIIATEIRLQRAVHKGSFLLLEGDTDVRFLKRLIDVKACAPIACFGKQRTLDALAILVGANFPGVLAVVDSDYDIILERSPAGPNVCLTDHNDLELTLFVSPAFQRLLDEFGHEQKIRAAQDAAGQLMVDQIICEAAVIGSVRLASLRANWSMDFDGFEIRFKPGKGISVDRAESIRALLARSRIVPALTVADVAMQIASNPSLTNPVKLCNGHDICQIAARALNNWIGGSNWNRGDANFFFSVLGLAFDKADFAQTQTFACIASWESRNRPYTVL